MVFCSECGAEATGTAKFCAECGQAIKSVPAKEAIKKVTSEFKHGDAPSFSKVAKKEVASAIKEQEHKERGYGYQSGKQESVATLYIPKEVDTSDPEIKAAWKRVSSDKDKANYLVLMFKGTQEQHSDALTVREVGTGGHQALVKLLKANQGSVFFGVLLVEGTNVAKSVNVRRNKFVYFSFVGSAVPELVAAQVGPLKRKVEPYFGATALALELRGSNLSDVFTANQIAFKLDHGSGSHKCDKYNFGDGTMVQAKSVTAAEDDDDESEGEFD